VKVTEHHNIEGKEKEHQNTERILESLRCAVKKRKNQYCLFLHESCCESEE
jgi:hypothetical protein